MTPPDAPAQAPTDLADAVTRHVAQRLQAAGPQGAAPPFGLRAKAESARVPEAIEALLRGGQILQARGGAKPHYVWAAAEVAPADALKALGAAKARGLTVDGLAKKLKVMPRAVEPALSALAALGQAVRVAKAKSATWYATPHRPPTLEDVTTKLANTLRGPALFDEADAKATLSARERPLLKQALPWLEMEGVIQPFTHTKRKVGGKPGASRTLWGFRAAQAQATAPAAPAAPALPPAAPAAPAPAPFPSAEVRAAYAALCAEGASPFVLIAALRARGGVALAPLHGWLVEEARAGRAQLTGTNLAALLPDAAAAAVAWGGELCALVRLVGASP